MVTKGFFYNCFSIRYDEQTEPESEEEEVESENKQGQKLVSSDALAVEVLHSRQFQSFCHLLTDI